MDKNKIKKAHTQYRNRKINAYELADILGKKYTEIGTYIMVKGLHIKRKKR
jgi:hypothetical protein